MGDQIEINIRKIKTKHGASSVDIPVNVQSRENGRLSKREQRKNRREARRKAKELRNE